MINVNIMLTVHKDLRHYIVYLNREIWTFGEKFCWPILISKLGYYKETNQIS